MNLQTVLLALSMAIASSVANAALVATYQFQNTLAADQSGITALAAVDPLGLSGFQTATLYG